MSFEKLSTYEIAPKFRIGPFCIRQFSTSELFKPKALQLSRLAFGMQWRTLHLETSPPPSFSKGRTIIFLEGGGGGGGMKNFPLQTFFFNLCTSANTFFFEMQTNFFTHIVFASNLFCLFRPCKHFLFQYFSYPPPEK